MALYQHQNTSPASGQLHGDSGGGLSTVSMSMSIAMIFRIITIIFLTAIISYGYIKWRNERKLQAILSTQHNCAPLLPRVPYKWPLALDLLAQQYSILLSSHTFERLTPFFHIAPTVGIDLFGVTGIFTTDPRNIETILSARFDDYSLGTRRLATFPLMGEGIFSQDGKSWRISRELVRRQFVRVGKASSLGVFAPFVGDLVSALGEAAAAAVSGEEVVVDMKPFFFEYTLSTTTQLLFGEPHSSLPREEREAVRDNFDYAAAGIGIRVRLANLAWLYNPPRYREACRRVRDWAGVFVGKAMRYRDEFGIDKAAERYPFIIDLWKEMGGDEGLVRDQLLHVLVAGRDSTAALLSWTFFHLIRNPDVLNRLRREVSVVPTGQHIAREQIQRLPFLRCCLNEILRLYPSLPLNIRFANTHTILPQGGGLDGKYPIFIPRGTGIAWSVYHLHRLESIYGPDARAFNPSRWESGELARQVRLGSGAGVGFVDFNGGPRVCLGKDFALMEASYAVIRILQAFPDLRLPPGTLNEPIGAEGQVYSIGITPADGVKALLV